MSARPDVLDRLPLLAELAARQSGVLTRRQLRGLGVDRDALAGQLRARRWREPVPGVVVLHLGPLDPHGRCWLAVLAGGSEAAICAWTALEVLGLVGWERPVTHVVVPRGRIVPDLPDTYVHESRRHSAEDITRRNDLPLHTMERAAIDAASWSSSGRAACGLLAAVVQQGLSTPTRLLATLEDAGRIVHRKIMIAGLADIEGGSRAMSEIDLARLCRAAGLPIPTRQRIRQDGTGRRRYLDAEWELRDGRVVGLEVDGIHHMEVGQWYADLLRDAELQRPSQHRIIRLPAMALRWEPKRVVAILAQALSFGQYQRGA